MGKRLLWDPYTYRVWTIDKFNHIQMIINGYQFLHGNLNKFTEKKINSRKKTIFARPKKINSRKKKINSRKK
jgi:hypothetical protein